MSPFAATAIRRRRLGRGARGAAIVEFALVVPLLITMILFSMYFVELVRAKLKLQEAGRYAAWEMTSYVLTDFGSGRHDVAFNEAMTKTVDESKARFFDMDSVDEHPNNVGPAGTVAYSNVNVTIKNMPAPAFTNPIPSVFGGGGPIETVLSVLNSGTGAVLNKWGFNDKGQVQAEVTMKLDNFILPKNFMNGSGGLFQVDQWGGRNLQQLSLKNRFTLVATGWNLPDGADAEMHDNTASGGPRAGVHRGGSNHGLYTQVGRMKFLGLMPGVNIPVLGQIGQFATLALPNPFGTFVTAHNYGLEPGNRSLRECTKSNGQGYPGHPAQDGLNNLDQSGVSKLDYDRNKCFDTIPFRDQDSYSDSQYVEMFKARGPYFMGCKKPMADDPTVPLGPQSSNGDKNNKKENCEGP